MTIGLSAVALVAQAPAGAARTVPLRAGMVITTSTTIRSGTYRLSSGAIERPAIVVRGSNITVDFNGAELVGSPIEADPDTFAGLGVLVDGGANVTIRNARIRGYKVGLLARDVVLFHLTHGDLSHNWKQRLYSLVEHESLADWMSYHQNDRNEWLRYGAAIYLDGCRGCEIDHVTAVQGQNGLLMTRVEGSKVWNNTFSFLSALGIGLYRSSGNTIMHNKVDWCVRGYSHGFYNRGQDSAGILMYEQSSRNTVAYNSVTHGGDGLFLWAGQSTMDTGQGGCNDNYFYRNDFSHAPANGIEATFSRNRFHENRVEDNWHGVWGGYSYDMEIIANRFRNNEEGIAIEHGQGNTIVDNRFDGDDIAIRLWANERQDPNWGYPKRRDTRSRDYYIAGNAFSRHKTALQVDRTGEVVLQNNRYAEVETVLAAGPGTANIALDVPSDTVWLRGDNRDDVERLPAGMDPMIPDGGRRGRESIIVDEWGPYDWKAPKLWPEGRSDVMPLKLRVLGPAGEWKVASVRGATVTPGSGRAGEVVEVRLKSDTAPGVRLKADTTSSSVVDLDVQLEYRGGEVVDPRGRRVAAGSPVLFGYQRYFVPIEWDVRMVEYTDATDPLKQPETFARLLRGASLKRERVDRLDYISGRAIAEGLPRDRVGLLAEGAVALDAPHELLVISDDGVRIWIDDRLALDRWDVHESAVDRVPIGAGRHTLRVEYFEQTGFAELRVEVRRPRTRKRAVDQ